MVQPAGFAIITASMIPASAVYGLAPVYGFRFSFPYLMALLSDMQTHPLFLLLYCTFRRKLLSFLLLFFQSSSASSSEKNLHGQMCPFVRFIKLYVPSFLFRKMEIYTTSSGLITLYICIVYSFRYSVFLIIAKWKSNLILGHTNLLFQVKCKIHIF